MLALCRHKWPSIAAALAKRSCLMCCTTQTRAARNICQDGRRSHHGYVTSRLRRHGDIDTGHAGVDSQQVTIEKQAEGVRYTEVNIIKQMGKSYFLIFFQITFVLA